MRSATAYVISAAALVAAVALRWLLDPMMGDSLPLVTLFGAVAVSAWVGGWRPPVLVAIVGYLACHYLFIAPRGAFELADSSIFVGLAAYLFTCALIIAIGEAMRRARAYALARGEVLRVTLGSIGDAVITTDTEGRVSYLNAVAEALTGWTRADALGQPLEQVFRIVDEASRAPAQNPAVRALGEGAIVGLANHTLLIAKDGTERPIDDSAAPIKDQRGAISGCVLIFRDVTERRRVERGELGRLIEARQLAAIVESSDDAIIRKSLDGVIQSWNAAAERLFGYTAAEAIGRHISLVIPPDRIAEEEQIIASLRAGRRVDHFETVRMRSDGAPIHVSLTISPIRDESGEIVAASKIVRDITRQRQVEARERELLAETASANAKFRAFFEQGALFAGIMDVDGTLLEPNRLSYEGCGYTRDEVTGRKFWEGPWWTPSPALVETIRAGSAKAAAGETFHAELPYYVKDGSERYVDVMILPIKDEAGSILFLAPTGTDITDRKRAEADRERFEMLVENSTDFIGICDMNTVPIYINPAGLRMVGLDSLEAARKVTVRDFFFPEDQDRMLGEFFAQVMRDGHGAVDVRFRHFQTGEPRWMSYKVLKLDDASGTTLGFATVSQDVTERRALEDNLRKLASDLSDADRKKDEFLATLAHELRNPLAPLANMLEVLKRAGGEPATLPHAFDTMGRQLGQLVRLVDDLLDLSRITHNRLDLRRSRVELASVIEQAVLAARPMMDASGHELRVDIRDQPIVLDADPVRLAQVLGNLLNNACKYTARGGRISIAAERDGGDAVVTVRDNGVGIVAGELDRIFGMFAQIDHSLERSQGGLGIGLTLVKRLVEMHGGTVKADSAGEGLGSAFVVRIPIVVGVTAAAPAPAPVARRPQPLRVLIADDNHDAASSLAMLLELDGHTTYTAADGAAALAAAERHRPDIALIDIGMPKVNGYDVCRQIRSRSWGKGVVLIALTGWGQAEDRRRSQEAGFDTHLVKPVDPAALGALLDATRSSAAAE